jgi:predicted nucleic acid-binding protein
MPRSVVADASPLIFLARADLLELLRRPDWDVVVPDAVRGEIVRRGPEDRTASALATSAWIGRACTSGIPSEVRDAALGPGESEVLALALARPGSLVLVDDARARRAARRLGVAAVGTLGLVLAARSSGRIASARGVLVRLREEGMYLSDRVLDAALREIGE